MDSLYITADPQDPAVLRILASEGVAALLERLDERTLDAMRGWLSDCLREDVNGGDIAEMPAERIVRAVDRHYSGGIEAFLRALG